MAEFKLTNKAVEDLSKIWDYTFELWSEKQADKYYLSIKIVCAKIGENPHLGKTYNEIRKGLLGFISGKHIIFYRIVNENEIEVIRILHERMDLKNRITE